MKSSLVGRDTDRSAGNWFATRWRGLGVSRRLMAAHIAVMTVVIGAIVVQSNNVLTTRLNSHFNRDLSEEGPEFTSAAANRPRGQPLQSFTAFYLNTHLRLTGQSLIIALDRPGSGVPQVLFSSGAGAIAANRTVAGLLGASTRRAHITGDVRVGGSTYRVFASPISQSGRRVATLVAVRDLATLSSHQNSELMVTMLEGLAALIAAVLAGYLLLRRVLRVVSDVTDAAEKAAAGDLSLRVGYRGPDDELGHLAHTVDTMLGRLDRAFSAQRRLLSDVSHQLRTPLTVIRGHLEVLARDRYATANERAETIALVVDELEHVSLMVERLLLLGRALEPDFIEEEPIDVCGLLEDVVDAAQYLAPRLWELDAGPPLVITADRTKLRGALLNLIDNAVKATGESDTIRVAARHDGELIFEVADTGRGLARAEQEHLFERFSRSSDRYRGNGLGLAIVKAVAEAHGGRVELDSEPGRGARFRIVLPQERIVGAALPEAVIS